MSGRFLPSHDEFLIRLGTGTFVLLIHLVAMCLPWEIACRDDVIGLQFFGELDDHRSESVQGARRLSFARSEIRDGVIGAMEYRVRIEEDETFTGGAVHR
jgi:hypothetical protein